MNDWNGWTLASDEPAALVWSGPGHYYITLKECRTAAQVLDWIMQVRMKTWADDACIAGLVNAFDDVLHPQAYMCSGGKSLAALTNGQIGDLVARARTSAPPAPKGV